MPQMIFVVTIGTNRLHATCISAEKIRFDFVFLACHLLKKLIAEIFLINQSISQIGRIFAKLGLTNEAFAD